MTQNICPVCGYPDLSEPAYPEGGWPSDEICESCGYQFGYHDAALEVPITFEQWRERWIANGMIWDSLSVGRQPPVGWNPRKQLENIGIFLQAH
ncbi:MAG: hypothetical protein V4735_07970 [Pseudomonadota bacterium]